MKDYQEALDNIRELKTKMYVDFVYRVATKGSMIQLESAIDDNLNTLQELVNEKVEQESRKDYLKVGSEWECIVSCFANDSMFYKVGTKVKVLSLEEYDRVFFVRVKSEWQEVIFVVDQFLLCFKPLKEEE